MEMDTKVSDLVEIVILITCNYPEDLKYGSVEWKWNKFQLVLPYLKTLISIGIGGNFFCSLEVK